MNKFRIARAGINVNEAITRLGGDVDVFEKLLGQYLNYTYLEDMKAEIAKGDVKAAFQAAHALKGVAGNLSLTKLYEALDPVVEKLRIDDMDVAEYMPALEEANAKVVTAVTDMVSKKS